MPLEMKPIFKQKPVEFEAEKPAVFFDDDDLYEVLPDKVSHVPDNEEAK